MATASPQPIPPFLRLPREIRDHIYHYLIHPQGQRDLNIDVINSHPSRFPFYCLSPDFCHLPVVHFRLLNLILVCRQIYYEATPLFYSTNTFVLHPMDTIDFLASLTPVTRCLIQSWFSVSSSHYKADWVGIRQFFEHQTDMKRILITHSDWLGGPRSSNIDLWKAATQAFLCMPKLLLN